MIMHFSWYAQNQCFNFLLMVGGVGMGEGQEMIEVEADDVGGGAGEEGALTSCGWGDDY